MGEWDCWICGSECTLDGRDGFVPHIEREHPESEAGRTIRAIRTLIDLGVVDLEPRPVERS